MPIAKSAPQSVPLSTNQLNHSVPDAGGGSFEYNGVPVDVYGFFGVEFDSLDAKDIGKLREIYSWAKEESDTLGDAMEKIARIERQIGYSGLDKRYDRVWNWVSITNKMKDLDKRRNALKRTSVLW